MTTFTKKKELEILKRDSDFLKSQLQSFFKKMEGFNERAKKVGVVAVNKTLEEEEESLIQKRVIELNEKLNEKRKEIENLRATLRSNKQGFLECANISRTNSIIDKAVLEGA